MQKKVIIIGAGPAGLTAGVELLRKSSDYEVLILEESQVAGGISRTVKYGGKRMDIGGHRFFSKSPEVNRWWRDFLPLQGKESYDDKVLHRESDLSKGGPDPEREDRVMLSRTRISRIYYKNSFFDTFIFNHIFSFYFQFYVSCIFLSYGVNPSIHPNLPFLYLIFYHIKNPALL